MKYLDIICDLETLGQKEDDTIIEIAAISCDIATGTVYEKFDVYVDIDLGALSCTGSTLKWWLDTDPELFKSIIDKGNVSEEEAIEKFITWINYAKAKAANAEPDKKCEVFLWGNGILFDNAMIRRHCEMYGLEYPIAYWNDRDLRTLLQYASFKSGKTTKEIRASVKKEDEVSHNALNDCFFELRLAKECHKILVGKGPSKKSAPKKSTSEVTKSDEKADKKTE